jgi:3-oxoacyl-[acyl-carrier protein] reductase
MGDRYARFAHTTTGRALLRRFGLPEPPRLRRYRPGDPLVPGPVLLGDAPGGRVSEEVQKLLGVAGVEFTLDGSVDKPSHPDRPPLHAALVFDATGIADPEELESAYSYLRTYLRTLYPNGRVLLLAAPPDATGGGLRAMAAQRALEGLLRSLAKELRRGSTGALVQVAPGAEGGMESTLRFLLSARSAYLSGQVIRIDPAPGRSTHTTWAPSRASTVAVAAPIPPAAPVTNATRSASGRSTPPAPTGAGAIRIT